MKKLLSTKYSAGAFSGAMLLLRLGSGILMMGHGYNKLVHFNTMRHTFMNFMGLGSSVSLTLDIFAELCCAFLIVIGLFTRLVTIPLIIAMSVAFFKAHNAELFGKGELPALFLACFLVLLLVGPGRISVDGIAGK